MEDLDPVVNIVQQRIKDGDTPATLRAELIEKGYTQEQSDWIFSNVTLPQVTSKKSSNGFDIAMIGLGIVAIILFAVTIPDYGFGDPRPMKDIEVPELVDSAEEVLEKPDVLTLNSGQTMSVYKLTTGNSDTYQGPNKYDIDPYAVGVISSKLSILFEVGLNVLMLNGIPEECHLRDRYSIKKVLATGDTYMLEAVDLAEGSKTKVFSGCLELGKEYGRVWDPIVVGNKIGFIGSEGDFSGVFNFDGKEYGSGVGKIDNVFLLDNEVVFVAYSEAYRGDRYLYRGDKVVASAIYDEGGRILHPFKIDNKLGYVLETTDKLEFVLDGKVIFEHRKVNISDNLFIDLKFSDTEGYIAMKKPNRVLYFSKGSYRFIDGIDNYVRPTDWHRPENNQTDSLITFAVQKDGKTLIYRGGEVVYEIENPIRTNTITFSETGDFAYTFDGHLYLNGTRLAGQFDKDPVLTGTFDFQENELLFSSLAADTYAGEIYSIREQFEDEQYYVNVHPYIIEGYPLFYVKKFGKRNEDVPTSHFLMYEENTPWAPTIEKTVTNIKLLKE